MQLGDSVNTMYYNCFITLMASLGGKALCLERKRCQLLEQSQTNEFIKLGLPGLPDHV